MASTTSLRTILHLGAGWQHLVGNPDYPAYPADEWREIRVDLDPLVEPDIVADVTSIPLPDGSVDAFYSSHVLEHIPEIGLLATLTEWHRLLAPDGEGMIRVPDIQEAARWIADGRGIEPMYWVRSGTDGMLPIRPIDLFYGLSVELGERPLMSHRTGFTDNMLAWWLAQAGFDGGVERVARNGCQELVATVHKNGRQPRRIPADRQLILVNHEGATPTMESHPETPDRTEGQGPGSQAQVADHAEIRVEPPPVEEDETTAADTDDDDA
jgi:SAM-dependent methyltransferase